MRLLGPRPLGLREVAKATVLPWRPGEEKDTLEMGVLDARGHAVRSTLIRRSYANNSEGQIGYPGPLDPAPERPGTAIYAGPYLEHFGHFLLEGLARAWAVMRHPELPVVWSAAGDREDDTGDEPGLAGWRTALIELLGMRNEMIFATEPMRFERLLVPDPGYQIQHSCHPEHAAALGVVEHRPEPGRKLWLTRTKLLQLQNLSISKVETRLAELGWTVIAPETLTIPEQIAHLARAERVAGEMGSQLHPLLFLKAPTDLRVDVFLRDPTRSPGLYNRNYDTIAEAKGFDQRLHHMASEVVLRKDGLQIEKLSTDLAEYFRALDVPEGPGEAAEAANTALLAQFHARPVPPAPEDSPAGDASRRSQEAPEAPDLEGSDHQSPDLKSPGTGSSVPEEPVPESSAPESPISETPIPAPPEGPLMPNDLATPDAVSAADLALGPDGRPTLDALAEKFNTDKASRCRTRDGKEIEGHGYAAFYERFFRDFRDEPIAVMELGCGQIWNIGASLRMLKAYFPEAEVVGVDNKPAARRLVAEGFRIEVGDLGKIEFLRRLRRYRPTILIEDASHLWSHQILAMAELYDTLPSGGIYVMEDINTSFGRMRETYSEGATFSGHDFVTAVSTALHAFDADHLKTVPYPEYVAYVARQTAFVAQFRHTALFVRR